MAKLAQQPCIHVTGKRLESVQISLKAKALHGRPSHLIRPARRARYRPDRDQEFESQCLRCDRLISEFPKWGPALAGGMFAIADGADGGSCRPNKPSQAWNEP